MFLATRPTRRIIERFRAESEALPLSYGPVGLVQGEAPGYRVDELVVPIGRGEEDFGPGEDGSRRVEAVRHRLGRGLSSRCVRGSFDVEWRRVTAGDPPCHIRPRRQERRD
jgi:hypothetical protein